MEDNNAALKAVREKRTGLCRSVHSAESGSNYKLQLHLFKGKFGAITMVELTGTLINRAMRRPKVSGTTSGARHDWKRFLLNRPYESFDPRKYMNTVCSGRTHQECQVNG